MPRRLHFANGCCAVSIIIYWKFAFFKLVMCGVVYGEGDEGMFWNIIYVLEMAYITA
jgi:hypothetical protein